MDKIYLSRTEREVLLSVRSKGGKPGGLSDEVYLYTFIQLREKGLASGHSVFGKVKDVSMTDKGLAYMNVNPKLRNPFPWKLILDVATIVAAISATAALFVGCARLLRVL